MPRNVGSSEWPGPDRSHEVNFWRVREIKRLWRQACEGYGLYQRIWTPTGWTDAIPSIGRVTLGHPTAMTVQLRPGQRPEHIGALAHEIADVMGVGKVRVIPLRSTWLRIELLAAGTTPAAGFPSPQRRGPSAAWIRRLHALRLPSPEQPT